jgi:hypothetical protein
MPRQAAELIGARAAEKPMPAKSMRFGNARLKICLTVNALAESMSSSWRLRSRPLPFLPFPLPDLPRQLQRIEAME